MCQKGGTLPLKMRKILFCLFEDESKNRLRWCYPPSFAKTLTLKLNARCRLYDPSRTVVHYVIKVWTCRKRLPRSKTNMGVTKSIAMCRIEMKRCRFGVQNGVCIRSAQLTQNHNQIGYAWYPWRAVTSFPVERSSEVTLWRHRVAVRFLPITFDKIELEKWGWCQCSSRQGTLPDTQHDLLRSHCDLDLAWPEVKF